MISARKVCLSSKRKVIDGESLISTAEKLSGVRDAEWITQQRQAKRQKVSKRHGSKARKKSNDKSEIESDDSNEGLVEIMDCIKVQS